MASNLLAMAVSLLLVVLWELSFDRRICSSFGVNTYRWPSSRSAAEEMATKLKAFGLTSRIFIPVLGRFVGQVSSQNATAQRVQLWEDRKNPDRIFCVFLFKIGDAPGIERVLNRGIHFFDCHSGRKTLTKFYKSKYAPCFLVCGFKSA